MPILEIWSSFIFFITSPPPEGALKGRQPRRRFTKRSNPNRSRGGPCPRLRWFPPRPETATLIMALRPIKVPHRFSRAFDVLGRVWGVFISIFSSSSISFLLNTTSEGSLCLTSRVGDLRRVDRGLPRWCPVSPLSTSRLTAFVYCFISTVCAGARVSMPVPTHPAAPARGFIDGGLHYRYLRTGLFAIKADHADRSSSSTPAGYYSSGERAPLGISERERSSIIKQGLSKYAGAGPYAKDSV